MSSGLVRLTSSYENLAVDPIYARSPELSEVLLGGSSEPWTLAAFTNFLENNYCAEVLQFITDVVDYRKTYDSAYSAEESEQAQAILNTQALWRSLMETYILPNAVREINIPGAVRNSLLAPRNPHQTVPPDVLQAAYDSMYELLGGIFTQFVEAVRPSSRLSTVSEPAQWFVFISNFPLLLLLT